MLDPTIRKFLSNIGKRGGTKTAELYDMQKRGAKGGLMKSENRQKKMTYNELQLYERRKLKRLSTEKAIKPLT